MKYSKITELIFDHPARIRLVINSLHRIKKLIVINHRDCGAAKIINGKNFFSRSNETKIHIKSFKSIKKKFNKKYPKLRIELNLISLNKKIETYK